MATEQNSDYEVILSDGTIKIAGTGPFVSDCVNALQGILQARQVQAFQSDGGKLRFEAGVKKAEPPK